MAKTKIVIVGVLLLLLGLLTACSGSSHSSGSGRPTQAKLALAMADNSQKEYKANPALYNCLAKVINGSAISNTAVQRGFIQDDPSYTPEGKDYSIITGTAFTAKLRACGKAAAGK